MAGGRPTKYSPELAELICNTIATSANKSIVKLCEENEQFPDYTTIKRWLRDESHAEFRTLYAQAKEDQAEMLAEEIIAIADDSSNDEITTEDGRTIENREFINRSKLRVDARKWVAAKLLPRKYGDRNQIEFPDKDGNPQAVGGILGDTERSARLLFLLEQAEKRSKGGKS